MYLYLNTLHLKVFVSSRVFVFKYISMYLIPCLMPTLGFTKMLMLPLSSTNDPLFSKEEKVINDKICR